MSALYLSGWAPKNTPRIWDRTSISAADAKALLDRYQIRTPEKQVVSAVAWFDTRGHLRMMACDMADDRRVTVRIRGSNWSVEILPSRAVAA